MSALHLSRSYRQFPREEETKQVLARFSQPNHSFLFQGVCCLQTCLSCIYSSFPAGLLGMGLPCWHHSRNDNGKGRSLKGWTHATSGDASREMLPGRCFSLPCCLHLCCSLQVSCSGCRGDPAHLLGCARLVLTFTKHGVSGGFPGHFVKDKSLEMPFQS